MSLKIKEYVKGKSYSLKIPEIKIFYMYKSKRIGWVRIFGRGFKWKYKSEELMFSERNGYKKYITIGNWVLSWL